MTFRPMPVLTVLTLISLGILVWLGSWQYDRYTQKMAQADVETTTVAQAGLIEVDIETGNPGFAQNLYGAMDGEPTWRRYVPGRLDSGELVLVLWDGTGGPQPVPLRIADATGPYARKANVLERPLKRGTFAVADDPGNNVWHTMDTAGMAERLGYPAKPLRVVETIDITIRNAADMTQARRTANPYAFDEVVDPLPPERHFGYALTWWGMAIGLLAVYLALHYSRGYLRFRSSR